MSDNIKEFANFLFGMIIFISAFLCTLFLYNHLNTPFEFMVVWLLTTIAMILLNNVEFK